MISLSVKGEKVVDHFGIMNSDFSHSKSTVWTGDLFSGSKMDGSSHHLISPSGGGIEEYDPAEEDYEDEEYEEEEDVRGELPFASSTIMPSTTTTHDHELVNSAEEILSTPKNPNFLRFLRKLGNMTRDTGMDVRLGCEAEGLPPPKQIKWYKNGVQEQLRGDRIRIKHTRKKTAEGKKSPIRIVGSTLKIRQLEVLDKGFYTCEVLAGDGQKISSTGILNVVHDTESGVIPDFPSAFESFPEIGEAGSIHRIDSFQRVPLSNPGVLVSPQLQPPKDGHGFCMPYRGSICRKYLENRTVYSYSEESQLLMESKIKEAINLIRHLPDMSETCSTFGIPSLCHYAFPQCGSPPGVLRLCRADCEILEQNYCAAEYAMAKRHPSLPLPQCASLPPLGSGGCISLGFPTAKEPLDNQQSCYEEGDKGVSYRGPVSRSASGKKCKDWAEIQNQFRPRDFPELYGGHAFCRNPGGVEPGPWCYVGQREKEPCGIQKCGLFGADDQLWLSIAGGISALLLLLLCFLVGCWCRRGGRSTKKSKKSSHHSHSHHPSSHGSLLGSNSTSSPGSVQQLEMNNLLKRLASPAASFCSKVQEVPKSAVHFYEEIGVGAFGKVYKGEAALGSGDCVVRLVIKTLKPCATPKTRQDFFREMELMGELKHPNILCLLGVVTKGEPSCMLFEWMSCGDLHEFLIGHSPRGDPGQTEFVLQQNEMLFIATQLAAGMEYLAAHHYVHRDIAARNALVGDGLTVKISDFGLARDIYNSDYYRVHSKSLLPVRWMPPESILYGKFTTESDVYSFGVTLWEIYSYGLQPYFGFSNSEVVENIRCRQLLPCPELCPPRAYSLMVECWAELPHRRPSFAELHSRLKTWLLPLLGPNANFSPHVNSYNFLPPPSCASNNSVSSSNTNVTGPPSNNTNSTSVSNNNGPQQWPPLNKVPMQTFQPTNNANHNHCVAYQSTPIVGSGSYSPQYQNSHLYNVPSVTANYHQNTGRVSHSTQHSPSPYRVFMESKSTNI